MFIESEGILYRGPSPDHPEEVWDYPRKRWVAYRWKGPQPKGWGREIDGDRAEALKVNNPDAEHFMYYDVPPWSQPLRS